ncbi:STAS domain-containing protein [Nonomuraea sp. CA-141351]|uniref:STAS domain-containing protein n=1 Tax=Nonomuraea sp. CA-141351 TaxID=3239996 RepID=UPI003D8F8AFB
MNVMESLGQAGFSWTVTRRDGVAILTPAGELDLSSAAEFRRGFSHAMSQVKPVLIVADLQCVDFCDSSGLNALIQAAGTVEAEGGRLLFSGIQPRVARLLRMTGLDKRFRTCATADDAAALLSWPVDPGATA